MTTLDLENYQLDIKTERLMLKTLTLENMSEDYLIWLEDPEVTKYLEVRHSKQTIDSLHEYVNDMQKSKDNLLIGLFTKKDNNHFGNIKIGPVSWQNKRALMGILIGNKACWGKGYAPEAISSICDIARNTLNLNKIQAGAYASNLGSIKAFTKAGFEIEGNFKNYWVLNDKAEDEVFMGKCL